jgi:uncharacterized protein (DUF1499 family)
MWLNPNRCMMVLVSLLLSVAMPSGCSGISPSPSFQEKGKLASCPGSPNCVSTESEDPSHSIAPLIFKSSPDKAFDCLKGIVRTRERARVVAERPGYIHAEFSSRLGFVDDVEFSLDRRHSVIRMRSASRSGYFDFGVNRKRLEEIRTLFDKECKKPPTN